jgi:hypothetical protein
MRNVSEIKQLQELIEFYRSKLLLTYHYRSDNTHHQFFKSMTHALVYCQQYFALQRRLLPPAATGESEFRWFITFVFFQAAFVCNEQILYQLLSQEAPDTVLKVHDWTLGKAYRVLSGQLGTTATHYRAFDLLDAMNGLLNRQQYNLYETGRESLTTYHDRPFISTYGQKADLINPTLLFTILKDIGELFAGQITYTAKPAACSSTTGRKSSHR